MRKIIITIGIVLGLTAGGVAAASSASAMHYHGMHYFGKAQHAQVLAMHFHG